MKTSAWGAVLLVEFGGVLTRASRRELLMLIDDDMARAAHVVLRYSQAALMFGRLDAPPTSGWRDDDERPVFAVGNELQLDILREYGRMMLGLGYSRPAHSELEFPELMEWLQAAAERRIRPRSLAGAAVS